MTAEPTTHLEAELSALLDGELDAEEEATVRAHLDDCPGCREDLAEVEATRRLLRGLPFVDPPAGFVDAYIAGRRRRRRRAVVAAALASVATLATLVVSGAVREQTPAVEPELAAFAAAHAGDPMGDPTAPEDMDEPVPVVDRLADYERTHLHVDGPVVQLTFADPDRGVLTVFEGYGRLEGDDGWHDAERMEVEVDGDAEEGWMLHLDTAEMLVLEVDDVVYALVSDGPGQDLLDAASDLPAGDGDSIVERTGDVVVTIGRTFSP